jgi:reductive dehalogenase
MMIFNSIILAISTLFLLVMVITSIFERETRAVFISLFAILLNTFLWLAFNNFAHLSWLHSLNFTLYLLLALFLSVSLLKWFPKAEERDMSHAEKYDERDYMFSRNNLNYHPHLAEQYYKNHPQKRDIDEKIHAKPEIGEPGHLYYDPYYSPSFDAPFDYLAHTRTASHAKPSGEKQEVDKSKISQVVNELARFYGAVDVGFTPLKSYHIYSHAGRRADNWGNEVDLSTHSCAIAIVVRMNVNMIKAAPTLPVIMESAHQYVEAAKIANIVAAYIRRFGYDARAHTDGNYQVMCVPVAIDAGLGELGRLGIMMHPVYGPCVRISVVTTELELLSESPKPNPANRSIQEFCEICKKCADNCPTQSISDGIEQDSRGFKHWSINQETCFSYWKNIGTDCGFCIGVCPYTKPDTFLHKLVRFYISRNPINQRIALFMDDLFYGRNKRIENKNPLKIY